MSSELKGSVLLVDDESGVTRALRRLLKPLNCHVFIADSGKGGLEILATEKIDLVISDMRMPEMDGAAFLSQVAEKWPTVERILLTGFADLESTIAAINKGKISRYLNKPWDDDEILEVVERALRTVRLEQQNEQLKSLTEQQNQELKELNQGLEQKVAARTSELQMSERRLKLAYSSITQGYRATIRVFAELVQRRMKSEQAQEQMLGTVLVKMASELGYSAGDLKQLHYAWMLRNVGKVSFPDQLLNTTYISLDPNAQRKYHSHPLLAHASILTIRPLDLAASLIRQHKELLDGSGYPSGCKQEEIDPRAQLLCVVNDYQELVNGMLQQRPFSTEEALVYLQKHAGTCYRADAVELLARLLPKKTDKGTATRDKAIFTLDMKVGMVLSRDLYYRDDILLLTKGFRLDEVSMERIRELEANMDEIFKLYVEVR